jgi:uncharacterized membrane protein
LLTTILRMRLRSPGQIALALTMIGLGIAGLMAQDFSQVWAPVPPWLPARTTFVYLTALVSLAAGTGLLVPRVMLASSRLLFGALIAWLLVLRVPPMIRTPELLVAWTAGATAVMAASAWILYARHASERDQHQLGFLASETGIRIARRVFGISFVPFGLAHFVYLSATTVLIPAWLPAHVALAYVTGGAFIAGGLAVLFGVYPRLAALMLNVQMVGFLLVVWLPRIVAGELSAFQRGEVASACALIAATWVVTESYNGYRWVAALGRPYTALPTPSTIPSTRDPGSK